jgi:hypothetical protein
MSNWPTTASGGAWCSVSGFAVWGALIAGHGHGVTAEAARPHPQQAPDVF